VTAFLHESAAARARMRWLTLPKVGGGYERSPGAAGALPEWNDEY
jgi:hypothetical protein